jgi:hypothetical protein
MTDSRHRSAALHFWPQLHSSPTPLTWEIIQLVGADIALAQLNETDYEKLRDTGGEYAGCSLFQIHRKFLNP